MQEHDSIASTDSMVDVPPVGSEEVDVFLVENEDTGTWELLVVEGSASSSTCVLTVTFQSDTLTRKNKISLLCALVERYCQEDMPV